MKEVSRKRSQGNTYQIEKSSENISENVKKLIDAQNEQRFKDFLKYVADHAAFFTLLTTLLIGFTSVLIKGLVYTFMCGKYDVWNISHSYINISNENTLYEIFLYAALAIIYIVINIIPFKILTTLEAYWKRLFKLIGVILITSVGILFIIVISLIFLYSIDNLILIFRQVPYLLFPITGTSIMIYLFGIVLGVVLPKSSMNANSPPNKSKILWHKFICRGIVIAILASIASYIIIIYCVGRNYSSNQKTYKILFPENSSYAVVFENADNFIVSKCKIENNILKIDSNRQKLINKADVEISICTFKQVVSMPLE